ncbi:acetylcholinesterase-like [Babylonia areolata]|uniref:acetylcholinesterase-like n=1 Tax=Babylonia areolata TaxID=304850 RepID=UPI003FD66C06
MKREIPTLTATLILLMMTSSTFAQQAEVVNTTLGHIQGLRKSVLGKEVDVYYGIPYAKPPLGKLRFKRPEPAEPWSDIMSTVTKPNTCFQTINTVFGTFPGVSMWNPVTPMSEDCLYLNVWVPRGFGSEPPRAAMVWIHGGSSNAGSSTLEMYDGSKLAATQNVIVATINYRLGPLGFLYTGTVDAPGNQGLLDQSLALKWVHANVERFGGRQTSITIFGESAGSFSVGLHLLSPLSRNYFTRAIMQSGSPAMEKFFISHSETIGKAQKLSAMFGCSTMQCMQQVDARNLTDAQWALLTGDVIDVPVPPVIDNYFVTAHPTTLLAEGAAKDTELLIGVNKDEGMYFLAFAFAPLFHWETPAAIPNDQLQGMVRDIVRNNDKAFKAMWYEYVDRVVPAQRDSNWDIADDIVGDLNFKCPSVAFANAFASMGGRRDVYLYSFEHRLSNNPWPESMGMMHAYEIELVFGLPRDFNYTQEEEVLADRMMGYWTRFAETG